MSQPLASPLAFSLRTMFGVMLVASLVSAVLGWLHRWLPWSQFAVIATFTGGLVLSAAVVLGPWAYLHLTAMKLGGPRVARLKHTELATAVTSGCAGATLAVLVLACCAAIPSMAVDAYGWPVLLLVGAMGFYLGVIGLPVTLAALKREVEPYLHERGFMLGRHFYAWDDVRRYRWEEDQDDGLKLLVLLRTGRIEIPVVPKHREAIEAIFAERAAWARR
jgi:hypothetical protein